MTAEVKKRTGPKINGHDVTQELIFLEGIEARLDAIPTYRNSVASFRIIDNWLARDAKILELLSHPISGSYNINRTAIPNFPNQSLFSALGDFLFARRIQARTSARAICFKSNLRAFYLSQQPSTLWVAGQTESSEVLRKSMALRDQFTHSSGLLAPRIIAQDIESKPPYILEELIIGRPFGQPEDWALLVDKVLPSLFRFYEQKFIRHHPAAEIYNATWIYQGVANLISNFKEDKKWLLPPEHLLKAVKQCLILSDEKLPVCIGHGDLAWTNLVVAVDGSIVLLDWERSRELPIAEELIKLIRPMIRKHPHLVPRVIFQLRQLTEDPVAMSPKRQLLLASLDKIAGLSNLGKYRKAKRWLRLASNLITLPE